MNLYLWKNISSLFEQKIHYYCNRKVCELWSLKWHSMSHNFYLATQLVTEWNETCCSTAIMLFFSLFPEFAWQYLQTPATSASSAVLDCLFRIFGKVMLFILETLHMLFCFCIWTNPDISVLAEIEICNPKTSVFSSALICVFWDTRRNLSVSEITVLFYSQKMFQDNLLKSNRAKLIKVRLKD